MRHARDFKAAGRRQRPRAAGVGAVFALSALCGLWMGCNPMERYHVLKLFFDRPPEPPELRGASARAGATSKPAGTGATAGSVHKPYAAKQCDACHTAKPPASFEISAVDGASCAHCHRSALVQVAGSHALARPGACLWCHHPHESQHPMLLRVKAPELCMQCHEPRRLAEVKPAHADARRDCLNCHGGHGGQARLAAPRTPGPVRDTSAEATR
jgi:predicted CXXCH cytochrome family protein